MSDSRDAPLSRGLSDAALLVVGSALAAVFGFVSLRILLTSLPEADYGRYSLFQAVAGLLAVFLSWPLPAVLRLGAEEVEDRRSLGRTLGSVGALVLGSGALVALVVFVLRRPIDAYVGGGAARAAPVWGYVLAYALAGAASMLLVALLQPAGRVGVRTLVPALTRGAYALLLLVPALEGTLTLDRVLLLVVLATLPGIVAPLLLVRRTLDAPRVDAATVRRAARFGGPLIVRNLAATGLLVVDVFVINQLLGPAAAGHYDVAYRVAEQVVVFGFVLDFVSGPMLATAAARGERRTLERFVGLAMPPLALLWSLAAALLVVFSRPIMEVLGAPAADTSARVLEVLAVAIAVRGVTTLEQPVLDAQMVSAWPTALLVLTLVLNLALDVALIRAGLGVLGPAVATLVAFTLHGLVRSWWVGRRFDVPALRPYVGVAPAMLLAGIAPWVEGTGTRLLVWTGLVAVSAVCARRLGVLSPATREALREMRMPAALRRALDRLCGEAPGGVEPSRQAARGTDPNPLLTLAADTLGPAPEAPCRALDDGRRRVMLLTTELRPAGAERIVLELATRLDRTRHDVVVVSLASPGGDDGDVARALVAAGIPVVPLRARGKLDPGAAWRLLRALRRFRPHVLHAHLFHGNLTARLLGRLGGAQRVVSTIHIVERRDLPARAALERLTARLDDRTVCVSDAVARHARERLGVGRARLRVVKNGVDLARFARLPDPAAARAALGLPLDAPVVGALGRLDRQKGFDVLVRAFARVRHPGAVLAIAGAGPEGERLRALAAERGLGGRVVLLGHRADVPAVLAAADVFCMPSRWEGFGLALVEAMAAGRPVIASAVDSLPEVLGEAGLLVAAEDEDALGAAIDALLADPARRAALGALARERARAFGVEAMLAGWQALYAEVGRPGSRRAPR